LAKRLSDKINRRGPIQPHTPHLGRCWQWTAAKITGYGVIKVGGKNKAAHRLMYEMKVGRIPDGKLVLHKCDNHSCVRPSHLFVGTHLDNMTDMEIKGRSVRLQGEQSGSAKLTLAQARKIYHAHGTQESIGIKFGVSQSAVSLIKSKKRWIKSL
jgi:hypothetical protein